MNDFREFSKAYNDYLQHGLPYAEDYICHFGILGMKWGVRRYQNPDGTLTDAGKKRYDKLNDKAKEYDQKRYKALRKDVKNTGIIDGMLADYYDKKASNTRKEANKYGTQTKLEKDSDVAENKRATDSGFKINEYGSYEKDLKVKDSNGKDKKITFSSFKGDFSEDAKSTFDNFEKNFAEHEKAIKEGFKQKILQDAELYKKDMDEENYEYFKKMANNVGKDYFNVRYVRPNCVEIDVDDGADDLFLPSAEYLMDKKKIMYVALND